MRKLFFISALCLLFASCGGDKGPDGGGVPSLKVEPSSLDFAAVSAPSQSVTVTAVNVEWEVRVSDTASAWLKAEKTDGTTVTVSVTDNGTPEQRTGSFTVVPTNNEDVKAKSVTVVQTGSDVEYKFSVEPAALTFEAEGAAAQTVTITAEGGLTWEAEVEGDAASWITVTPGEGTLEVKVSDNPETAERSGNIVVTPSAESVGAKAIRVTQAGKVLPPSLSINVEDPETGITFKANGEVASGTTSIQVTAVNTDWNARAVDAEGNAVTWFSVVADKENGLSKISINMSKNETTEERVGYLLITATVEEVPDIRVTVTQKGLQEYYSTLTENVVLDNLVNAKVSVSPTQSWDPETGASWILEIGTEGVEETGDVYNPYRGTGMWVSLEMRSEPIFFNDDNEYYMTDGEYTVTEYSGTVPPMHIAGGIPGYYDWQHPGSWVFVVEDGVVKGAGPLAAGTITVSRDGDRYTFVFDCQDDFEFTMTGTSVLEFVPRCSSIPTDPPITPGA